MMGDLSISGLPATADLATGDSLPRRATVQGDPASDTAPAVPDRNEPPEMQRLRALLSDPDMQVSTRRDEPSGHVVMRIESRATGEMVEQIPSEKLLRLYAALRETLFDETV